MADFFRLDSNLEILNQTYQLMTTLCFEFRKLLPEHGKHETLESDEEILLFRFYYDATHFMYQVLCAAEDLYCYAENHVAVNVMQQKQQLFADRAAWIKTYFSDETRLHEFSAEGQAKIVAYLQAQGDVIRPKDARAAISLPSDEYVKAQLAIDDACQQGQQGWLLEILNEYFETYRASNNKDNKINEVWALLDKTLVVIWHLAAHSPKIFDQVQPCEDVLQWLALFERNFQPLREEKSRIDFIALQKEFFAVKQEQEAKLETAKEILAEQQLKAAAVSPAVSPSAQTAPSGGQRPIILAEPEHDRTEEAASVEEPTTGQSINPSLVALGDDASAEAKAKMQEAMQRFKNAELVVQLCRECLSEKENKEDLFKLHRAILDNTLRAIDQGNMIGFMTQLLDKWFVQHEVQVQGEVKQKPEPSQAVQDPMQAKDAVQIGLPKQHRMRTNIFISINAIGKFNKAAELLIKAHENLTFLQENFFSVEQSDDEKSLLQHQLSKYEEIRQELISTDKKYCKRGDLLKGLLSNNSNNKGMETQLAKLRKKLNSKLKKSVETLSKLQVSPTLSEQHYPSLAPGVSVG